MQPNRSTLRRGDVVTARGTFNGRSVDWRLDEVQLAEPALHPGDVVSWQGPPLVGRRYGTVLRVERAAGGLQLAFVEALVGLPRFAAITGKAARLERELPPRVAQLPLAFTRHPARKI